MDKNEINGLIVPVMTPIDENERIDESAFRKILRRLIGYNVNGVFVGGSAGEGPLFTFKEWVRMVEIAYDENKGEIFLLGGAIDTSLMKIKEKIKVLKNIGYKYFVVTPGFYITLKNDNEFLRLFGGCKEFAGNMEMIAYNIPSCTSSVIPVGVMSDMARRGWIRYCKESSGDFDYLKDLINLGQESGLKVLNGHEPYVGRAVMEGACGVVPVCANYDPLTFIGIYEAAKSMNPDKVDPLQKRIDFMRDILLLSGSCWISGLKYAISYLGMGSGKPVSPLEPLSEPEMKRIRDFVSTDIKTN
jgi:4-hydroxy-tetrahydrodipicolinate synthase